MVNDPANNSGNIQIIKPRALVLTDDEYSNVNEIGCRWRRAFGILRYLSITVPSSGIAFEGPYV